MPARMRIRVVLPAPLAPSRPNIPLGTTRSRPSMAATPPRYVLVRPEILIRIRLASRSRLERGWDGSSDSAGAKRVASGKRGGCEHQQRGDGEPGGHRCRVRSQEVERRAGHWAGPGVLTVDAVEVEQHVERVAAERVDDGTSEGGHHVRRDHVAPEPVADEEHPEQ